LSLKIGFSLGYSAFLGFLYLHPTKALFKATLMPLDPKFESPYVTLSLENGIIYCRYTPDLHLNLEVAKACVEARIFFSKGKGYPLLIDMKGIKSTTGAARKYLATMGATLVTAGALLTGSVLNKTLGNLFLKIDMPPVPTKMFTNEEKAKLWLRQYA
jgi:hypothetical protein